MFCISFIYSLGFYDKSKFHNSPIFLTVPQSVYIEGKLIHPVLWVICCSSLICSINSFEFDHNAALLVPVNNEKFLVQSSYLTNVSVTLRILPDCVRWLNQLGSQIHSFIVRIVYVYQADEDLSHNWIRSVYWWISFLKEYYFIYASFTSICSILRNATHIEVDTIHQSFTRQHSIDCILAYFNNQYSQCQIYSLQFIDNRLNFISNRFPLFDDVKPFENVLFLCMCYTSFTSSSNTRNTWSVRTRR